MLSVKFESPIVIDEKNLGALLALAGVAARVEPYVEGAKVRKPRVVAEAPPAAEPEASAPVPEVVNEVKRPGRPKKAEVQMVAQPEPEPEAPAADEGGEAVDAGTLLSRFSGLIDQDFEAAKGLLDRFGVAKFSDLPEGEFAAFSNALSEAGN